MRVASSAVLNVTAVVNIKFCDQLALAEFAKMAQASREQVLPPR